MKRGLTALSLALVLPLAACGDSGDDRTLTVLAASSLTETFTQLAHVFEEEHPGVEVELVFGSSTALAEQSVDGAPGGVLATADERSMLVAQDGNALADTPAAFTGNELTIVTPPDNPAAIATLDDLDHPDVDYVVCATSAPCGVSAAGLLGDLGVTRPPASEEVDVKAVLARVVQGEADAGLVYRSDAVAAGDEVAEVALPVGDAGAYATTYFVAPLLEESDERADLAAEFVTLVRSRRAAAIFHAAGFSGVLRE